MKYSWKMLLSTNSYKSSNFVKFSLSSYSWYRIFFLYKKIFIFFYCAPLITRLCTSHLSPKRLLRWCASCFKRHWIVASCIKLGLCWFIRSCFHVVLGRRIINYWLSAKGIEFEPLHACLFEVLVLLGMFLSFSSGKIHHRKWSPMEGGDSFKIQQDHLGYVATFGILPKSRRSLENHCWIQEFGPINS